MTEQELDGLSLEELDQEEALELPDRELLSVVGPIPTLHHAPLIIEQALPDEEPLS